MVSRRFKMTMLVKNPSVFIQSLWRRFGLHKIYGHAAKKQAKIDGNVRKFGKFCLRK